MKEKRIPSIFGEAAKISYIFADAIPKNSHVLIPDDCDGRHAFAIASRNHTIDIYEPDERYINEHTFIINNKKRNSCGLAKRINALNKQESFHYHNESFYNCKSTKLYDAIFAYESLHRNYHSNIPLFEKINKLKDSLKPNGQIYIYYHLVEENENFVTYPYNSYFRRHEMIKYFDKNHFEIINLKERCKIRPFSSDYPEELKEHYIGYIQVRKKTKKEVVINHTYKFNIKLGMHN